MRQMRVQEANVRIDLWCAPPKVTKVAPSYVTKPMPLLCCRPMNAKKQPMPAITRHQQQKQMLRAGPDSIHATNVTKQTSRGGLGRADACQYGCQRRPSDEGQPRGT
eukprot:1153818-Pelagomonas_calceolata.AAC.2